MGSWRCMGLTACVLLAALVGGCLQVSIRTNEPPQTPRQKAKALVDEGYARLYSANGTGPRIFRDAIRADPTYTPAHFALGEFLVTDDPVQAEAEFRICIAQEPNSSSNYSWLGHALKNRGRLDEAAEAFQKAIDLHVGEPDGGLSIDYCNLGQVREAQFRTDDALRAYRTACEVYPEDPSPRQDILRVLFSAGRYEEAREECAALVKQGEVPDPDIARALGVGRPADTPQDVPAHEPEHEAP